MKNRAERYRKVPGKLECHTSVAMYAVAESMDAEGLWSLVPICTLKMHRLFVLSTASTTATAKSPKLYCKIEQTLACKNHYDDK